MTIMNEIITKGIELNNAIKRLNEETKVLNSIVEEKRNARKEDILHDLQKYIDIMEMLDINVICMRTNGVMYYNELNRPLGIRIRRHDHGVQIDLGCRSTVMEGFYAYHSIGYVISGVRREEIFNGFCDKWNYIRDGLDVAFAEVVEGILEQRKAKALTERECAIKNLTTIGK